MPFTKKPTARDYVLRLGERFADELNKPDQQRLVRLLELWCAWEAAPFVLRRQRRDGRRWVGVVPGHARARLQKELNDHLARYQFRRQVQLRDDEEFPVTEVLVGRHANSPGFLREAQAVGWFLRLAELGEGRRVRRCPVCEKWFMAARPDALYCGTRCARKKARQVLKETGKAAEYKRFHRKRQQLRDRIKQLVDKQKRGLHLVKREKSELADLKTKIANLHQEYDRKREILNAKN